MNFRSNFGRRDFRPQTRGDIAEALSKPAALQIVAPQSPRPVELLDGMTFDNGSTITVEDVKLHELLVSAAYQSDIGMTRDMHAVPMQHVLRFLGEHARRDAVKASLTRLRSNSVSFSARGTHYEQVPLLVSWLSRSGDEDTIHFELPQPLRIMMSDQREYAYLELAAMPRMRSECSVRLYKRCVAAIRSSGRKWMPGEDNTVVIEYSLSDLAMMLQFPRMKDDKVHGGKFRERVLSYLESDFADVRAFDFAIETITAPSRGNPIAAVKITLGLRAPTHHAIRAVYDGPLKSGGIDQKDLTVRSDIWLKAANSFGRLSPKGWFGLWTAAVHEMISGTALSDGCQTRIYRGDSLRSKIDVEGIDAAAWGFAAEEADRPDLLAANEREEIVAVAEQERRGRAWPKPEAAEPTFDSCSFIRLRADAALKVRQVEDLVIDAVERHAYSGGEVLKTIRIEWQVGEHTDFMDVHRFMIESDLHEVLKKVDRYIDVTAEYVA